MRSFARIFKPVFAAIALSAWISAPAAAQSADIDELLADLADPQTEEWQSLERRIRSEWSKSGSAAMDLLLQRGQKALEADEFDIAIEHLTALTDHAPEFAEGWNARATALYRKKLYGPALQDISRVLALNPRHFSAITGLAVILEETGYPEDALRAWRLMREIHPHRPELAEAIERLEKATEGTSL